MLSILEHDQQPKVEKKCQVAVVDITVNSTLLSNTLYCCRGTLIYGSSYPERYRGEFTVQALIHDFQGPRRSKDYYSCTDNEIQSQGPVERMRGCHRKDGKSCLVH